MKLYYNKFNPKLFVNNLILVIIAYTVSFVFNSTSNLFRNYGNNWTGLCEKGNKQSPVNIVEGLNTEEDYLTKLYIDYKFSQESFGKRFYYDGERMYLESKLGTTTINYKSIDKEVTEVYTVEKIDIKLPSEHYITITGFTPRYALEMQIIHRLESSNDSVHTNREGEIKYLSLNILFELSNLDNSFFRNMGVRNDNTNINKSYNLIQKGEKMNFSKIIDGAKQPEINNESLAALNSLLREDGSAFMYFGSETLPPCSEDTIHVVFKKPRSISYKQFDYLKYQMVKKLDNSSYDNTVTSRYDIYGIKRDIKYYDLNVRSLIKFLPDGVEIIN